MKPGLLHSAPNSLALSARALLTFATLLIALGCAAAREPSLVAIPQPSPRHVSRIETISDYRAAVASIAAVFERDLGFAPFPVTFHFYPQANSFEAALLAVGYEPPLAHSTAQTMSAIGGYRRVLLNEAALASLSWPSRVALLAHELTHSLQYELGGATRGASDQWLREGFADWLSMRVLDRLGALNMKEFRQKKLDDFLASNRTKAPRLDDMASFPQWVALGGQRDIAPYAQAFLAVDLLIERHGVGAVVRYFEQFASSQDRAGNFRAAFGEDLQSFEHRMMEHLRIRRTR